MVTEALKVIQEVTNSFPIQITSRSQVPNTPYIYMVYNGSDILQIGKTRGGDNGGRLCSLLKGARPAIHNKSFIVGLGSVVLSSSNEYVLFPMDGDIEEAEKNIHMRMGFQTNEQACVFLDGIHCKRISDANNVLWSKYKASSHYKLLNPAEKKVAEELFELIDSHKIRVVRSSGKSQPYSSGDILTGGILASQGLNGFTNLWQKITNKYFEYTDLYLLSEIDYKTFLESYKTIFLPGVVSGKEFCKVTNFVRPKNIILENLNNSSLGIDIVVLRSQIDRASLLLSNNKTVLDQCKTADMIFETNHPQFVLLVTRPAEKGQNKIEKLLSKVGNDSEVIFSNLARTNKSEKIQYFTDFGSCYIEFRKRGFKLENERYISQT